MIGLYIISIGMLLALSWIFTSAFMIGRDYKLHDVSLGISVVFSIAYVSWLVYVIMLS